jgi:hypothetical protein
MEMRSQPSLTAGSSVIRGCNNTGEPEIQQPSTVFEESPYRIFSQINPSTQSLLNILSTTTAMTMLRPIVFVTLLLLVVGSNSELLRGTSCEHTEEERNLGTCLCSILCQQCKLQGNENSQCQTTCAYSEQPNCDKLCDDFIHGIGNRDDRYAPLPLPADPPTPSPTCYCATLVSSARQFEAQGPTAKLFASMPPFQTPNVPQSATWPFILMNTIHNWNIFSC